ncbi:DUF4493 domain-containing protein [Barnesiella intestinihominis]|uniref:DUF4493 domain-containing protein n=1 Tax=Barnesiella intestinihominis TaxID=487174 RepID=UPI00266F8D8F|nr:DUF4493 domain-containing protein [Barnesiella intestinihominis]
MKLKKIFLYSATMLLLVSCANEDKQGSSGYGAINVQVSADYKVVPATRSTAESASTIENPDVSEFALKLVSSDGSFSRAWDSLADFDPTTKIPVGAYTMSAFYGDIDIEGFEKPFYLGETPVAVRDRENSSVEINCTLANVKVTVEYSDAFKKYFADYSTTIHSTGGEYIEFSKTETRAAYVKPGKITIQTHLKKQNGIESTFEPAAIPNAAARQHYKIKLDISDNNAGEAQLNISFDETTETQPIKIDISDEVMVAPAPSFLLSGFESGIPVEAKEFNYPADKNVNISLTAKGGLAGCTLTTSSRSLESKGWPQEIDLINMSEDQAEILRRLGLKIKGFSEVGNKMGFIDFTELFTQLQIIDNSDQHMFTISAKDLYGKVSESPISLSVKNLPLTFTLQEPEAVFVGSSSAIIPVLYDGSDIDLVQFSYLNPEGHKVNCTSTVLSAEENLYQVKISVEATNKPVKIEASLSGGLKTAATSIPVLTPEFTISAEEYDVWAKKAIVKLTAADPQYQDAVNRYAVLYTNSTGQWVHAASTHEGNVHTLTGLSPDTRYQIKGTCNNEQENVNYHGDCTIRTETTAGVPNGSFEELTQTISIQDMNQGGKYSVWPVDYQNTCSFTIQEPTGWSSVNAKTCNTSAANQMSWFVVPSTYNTTLSWSSYRSFGMSTQTPDIYKGLSAQDGNNAMVIRNVAWDANGTTPSKTGGAFNTTYYNTNVPSMSNRSAGKLFLGSYSYSGNSESYNEGTSFSSRPSTMKGWYKYTPDNNDASETGVISVTLLNGETVLASGTINLTAVSDYTEFTVPLVYTVTDKKANLLKIMITSSNHASYSQSEETATIKTTDYYSQYESNSRGATLTIDNLNFIYE